MSDRKKLSEVSTYLRRHGIVLPANTTRAQFPGLLHTACLMALARRQRGTVRLSQGVHAPKGGVTVGGKFFKGGEFIPGQVMAKATAAERAKVQGKPRVGKSLAEEHLHALATGKAFTAEHLRELASHLPALGERDLLAWHNRLGVRPPSGGKDKLVNSLRNHAGRKFAAQPKGGGGGLSLPAGASVRKDGAGIVVQLGGRRVGKMHLGPDGSDSAVAHRMFPDVIGEGEKVSRITGVEIDQAARGQKLGQFLYMAALDDRG